MKDSVYCVRQYFIIDAGQNLSTLAIPVYRPPSKCTWHTRVVLHSQFVYESVRLNYSCLYLVVTHLIEATPHWVCETV